jgi:hypothetical protein
MQTLFEYMLEQHGVTLLESDMLEITEMVNKQQGTSEILKELQRAETIHPFYPIDPFKQLAIMQEEAGEVTKAVLDWQDGKDTVKHVREELIQTAAMCMRMIKNLIDTSIHDLPNSLNDYVEVKSILRNPNEYKEWTKVSRFLASGLFGVEIREIPNKD